MRSRHLAAVEQILVAGGAAAAMSFLLALLGVDIEAQRIVAGVIGDVLIVVGGVAGVSAGRHLGEGFRTQPRSEP
jgi:uncharacterized membrane protein